MCFVVNVSIGIKAKLSRISQIASYVNPNYALVTRKFVDEAHHHQLQVMPYTVNKLKTGEKLRQMGVDGLVQITRNYLLSETMNGYLIAG